jgi:hypothetical protein
MDQLPEALASSFQISLRQGNNCCHTQGTVETTKPLLLYQGSINFILSPDLLHFACLKISSKQSLKHLQHNIAKKLNIVTYTS